VVRIDVNHIPPQKILPCSSVLFEYIRMSSIKTMMNLSNFGMDMEFMRYMKCVIAFVNPKDITGYS
jgi:hypothetical protein